jgi:hypothetical protein
MNRRQLLQGILAGGTAAIVSQFNVPEVVAEEIQEELITDLSKPAKKYFQTPNEVYRPPAELWQSTANVREVYAHYVAEELAKQVDKDIMDKLQPKIGSTVRRLVQSIDQDLSVANLEHSKVILGMPKVETRNTGIFTGKEPMLVLKAGAEHKKGFLGTEEVRVGYITESLVDRFGKKLGA